MGFRSLVSFGLIALPIGATLALLLGLDAQRKATGQQPLFVDNSVTVNKYCQLEYGITPPSAGSTYILNPNQWAQHEGDPGDLCMTVHQWNNGTYSSDTAAPPFSVTWKYPQAAVTQPVHAFPNIALYSESSTFPVQLKHLTNVYVSTNWTYGMGKKPSKSTNVKKLANNGVATNVAVDMFIAPDKLKSQSTQHAKFEVMVWLAMIGDAAQPLGYKDGSRATADIASTNPDLPNTRFDLYYGKNDFGQWVLTWLADSTTERFEADVAPLITGIFQFKLPHLPRPTDYFGYIGMGSEAYFSITDEVTFNVPNFAVDVR